MREILTKFFFRSAVVVAGGCRSAADDKAGEEFDGEGDTSASVPPFTSAPFSSSSLISDTTSSPLGSPSESPRYVGCPVLVFNTPSKPAEDTLPAIRFLGEAKFGDLKEPGTEDQDDCFGVSRVNGRWS